MRVRVEVIVRVRATLRTQGTLAERDGMRVSECGLLSVHVG